MFHGTVSNIVSQVYQILVAHDNLLDYGVLLDVCIDQNTNLTYRQIYEILTVCCRQYLKIIFFLFLEILSGFVRKRSFFKDFYGIFTFERFNSNFS